MDYDAIAALFEAALEVPSKEQAAFVRARCGDDDAMYAEVMDLLTVDAQRGRSPIDAALQGAPSGAVTFRPGERVGRYEILKQIGEGGFAVVYLAQQLEPVRRRVALKTIKPGMETKVVLTRFGAESQALAMMDHPYIAEVYDAGATERGLPYFAMEYVEGAPITEYCNRHQLGLDERLALFVQCCEAVQHAHLKAVIHRDLKPSNILVRRIEGRSVPKIIDFGVAKALEQKLTPDTIHTASEILVGTPAYMSPEQVSLEGRRGIDTRADVYSLGVVLYELLVGKMPFESAHADGGSLTELLRAIREDDAPRPSTRLSRPTRTSGTTTAGPPSRVSVLAGQLSGDLDWIVLKALEKDPDRRYGSPRELAEDIERQRANEPVHARPPSAAYRTKKFLRRNTGAVAAGVVALIFLVVLAATAALQARRERRARRELAQVVEFQAKRLKDIDAKRMGEQLKKDLLAQVHAQAAGSPTDTATESLGHQTFERLLATANFTTLASAAIEAHIFEPTLAAVDAQFDDQPEVKARLLQSLVYEMLAAGLYWRATAPQQEALAIRREVLGARHPDTLSSLAALGSLLREQGKLAEAEHIAREAMELRRQVLGETHPATLTSFDDVGILLRARGKLSEAEIYYRKALEGRRQVLGPKHPETLSSVGNLGVLLKYQGKLEEAERCYLEVLDGARQPLGDAGVNTMLAHSNLGSLLMHQSRYTEAEPHLRMVLEARREHLGDAHPDTLISLDLMGDLFIRRGRLTEAEPFVRRALEGRRRVLGDEHPATVSSVSSLGFVMAMQGEFAEAETHYRRAIEAGRRVWGAEHIEVLATTINLGFVLNAREKYTDSERLLREVLPVLVSALGDSSWRTAEARSLLGEALVALKRYTEAEPLLLDGYAQLEIGAPKGRRLEKLRPAARRLEMLYRKWNKPNLAAKWGAKHSE